MKKRQKLVDQLNDAKVDQFVFLLSSKGKMNGCCCVVKHITLYTSHVTRHTLHITRHTSHITPLQLVAAA